MRASWGIKWWQWSCTVVQWSGTLVWKLYLNHCISKKFEYKEKQIKLMNEQIQYMLCWRNSESISHTWELFPVDLKHYVRSWIWKDIDVYTEERSLSSVKCTMLIYKFKLIKLVHILMNRKTQSPKPKLVVITNSIIKLNQTRNTCYVFWKIYTLLRFIWKTILNFII